MSEVLRPILLALALAASLGAAEAGKDAAEAEASVRPGANEKFLSPDLDVEEWIGRFENESREIFRRRRQIVEQLGLRPGMAVADVGAGTGLFVGPLARAVGPEGTVYAVEVSPMMRSNASCGLPRPNSSAISSGSTFVMSRGRACCAIVSESLPIKRFSAWVLAAMGSISIAAAISKPAV